MEHTVAPPQSTEIRDKQAQELLALLEPSPDSTTSVEATVKEYEASLVSNSTDTRFVDVGSDSHDDTDDSVIN